MPEATSHPTPEALSDFGHGRLSDADSTPIEQHLETCAACRTRVEELRPDTLVSLLQGDENTVSRQPTRCSDSTAAIQAAGTSLPPELTAHPRYQLLEPLGSGGMGAVYKARHRLMERTVALKVINPNLVCRPEAVERFEREVRAAARLSHPNIVTAFDAEQAGGAHFLVMEFVEGTSLGRLVENQRPLPVARACLYVRQAALGLEHAFEHGMVHRDIKPDNLLLTPKGRVKILDFGLARFLSESEPTGKLTQVGMLMGTPDYMPPEQAGSAHTADIRADIYSLGCTLYHLLTGRPPFAGGTLVQKLAAHLQQTPRPLDKVRPNVPPGLARVVERMLAKNPAERFQRPAEVAQALLPFARQAAPPPTPQRGHRRLVWVTALAAALVIALSLGGLAVYRIATDKGTLVIETDDPDVEVVIKKGGEQVQILDLKTNEKIELKSGSYALELSGGKDGLKLSTSEFTLGRGDRRTVRVYREGPRALVRKKDAEPAETGKKVTELLEQARTLLASNQAERALAACTDALRLDPDSAAVFVLRSRANAVLNRLEDTIRDCTQALRLGAKEKADLYVRRSWAHLNSQAYDQCIADADAALQLVGQDLAAEEARANRGWAFYWQGRYAQALADFDEAIRRESPNALLHLCRSLIHVKLGNDTQAKADWKKALELDPKIAGHVLARKVPQQIVEAATQPPPVPPVAARDREKAGESLKRAQEEYEGKHYQEAINACSEAVRLDPTNPFAFRLRGGALVQLGRFKEAIPDYTQAIRLNPNEPQSYINRSHAFLNIGSPAECIADCNVALELTAQDAQAAIAYANRGWALAQLGHYELALADANESVRCNPTSALYLYCRGAIHAKRGNRAQAKADRDRAVQMLPALQQSVHYLVDPPRPPADEPVGEIRMLQASRQVNSVALSPDGRLALSGDEAYALRLWDVRIGKELYRFPGHAEIIGCVGFSPDGRRALSAGGGRCTPQGNRQPGSDFEIRIWDVATRKEQRRLRGHTSLVSTAVFSPDGKRVLSAGFDGAARLWDVETARVIHRIPCNPDGVWQVAISPDGTQALAAGGTDHTMYLWDLKTGRVLHRFKGHDGLVRSVAFSPDGTRALSGSWDCTVCLWNLATGKKLRTFPRHLTIVNGVAFSADGRWAIAAVGGVAEGDRFLRPAGPDCGIHVYDVATGEEVHTFEGHTFDVLSIAVTRDGRHLLSGSADATLRWWRLPSRPR
jgi:serine/threonine protein kinase/tetratricopeptide (TPR) repeat protein